MQDRCADLLDELAWRVAGKFDVLLKNQYPIRQYARMLNAAIGQRNALVEAKQQFVVLQPDGAELLTRRTVFDFDRDLLEVRRERLGQFGERLFNVPGEIRFAHVVCHGYNGLRPLDVRTGHTAPQPAAGREYVQHVTCHVRGNRMRLMSLALSLLVPAVAGCSAPSFLVTPVSSSTRLVEEEVQPGRGGAKVAIIEVEGMLMNARTGGFLQASENPVSLFAQEMDRAARDKNVKAVVLRINSPGGTVTASDLMYEVVTDFRVKSGKPVVASTQEVAASGGYYVACGADQIVAHPTSVVGSIGVIFSTLQFDGLMDKVGVRAESIKSGPLKDMGSPFKALAKDEREVMQTMVDEYHARFVDVVRTRRNVTDPDTLKLATDGRVFSGTRAVQLGLADRSGRLEDALDLARELGHAPGARVVIYKRPYGYGGSIHAHGNGPPARPDVMRLELPGAQKVLPGGFYYLWQPGL